MAGSAQQPYSLIHYDENILPQTSIGNIQQDDDGYLWMSTQFGIVRFDGEKIRVFTTRNCKGLTSNRIRLCAKGPDNHIYFLDENNILIRVKSPNQFDAFPLADACRINKVIGTSESNNDIAFASLGGYKDLTQLNGFLRQDTTAELLKTYALDQKSGYLFYLDLEQKKRVSYYNGDKYETAILSGPINPKHTFKLNNLIFSQTALNKVVAFKGINDMAVVDLTGLSMEFTQAFSNETTVLFSNETGAFFYSAGKLYEYMFQNGAITAKLVFVNLPCTGVVDVMKERTTGDFMISTRSTGFYRIKKQQFGVINLTAENKAATQATSGFNNNMVYSIFLWDAKNIFATKYITPINGPGISRNFENTKKAIVRYYFVYPKNKENIWFHSNIGLKTFIQNFDKNTGTFTPVMEIGEPRKAIEFSNGATVVLAFRQIKSLKDRKLQCLYTSDTLDLTTAEKITEDTMAVGSTTGIFYFSLSDKKLIPVPYKERLRVRFILKDKAGKIWFTTYGQGMFSLKGNTIIPIPLDNAGYLSIGHNISEDNRGNFWVPTNHGLFKLNYASLLSIVSGQSDKLFYVYFDKTDGFNTNEFNGGCFPSGVFQKETGLMFFPSMDGIVKFNPDSIRSMNLNSAIFFDQIAVNDTGMIYDVTDKTIFDNNTSNISIEFSSPYYGHVENVKFSYSLSNFPDHWVDLNSSRNITMSNLPGGTYTLRLRKEDATNAAVVATLTFEIQKRFTETLLFKFLLLGAVIGLVYLYFRARLIFSRQERTRLEKEVAVRTAEQLNLIEQQKDNISQLKQLQLEMGEMIDHKENVVAVLIHDIKSPLYFLNTVAAHLDKGIEVNQPGKNKKIAHEISISLDRLYIFTQDFATWLDASRPGYIQKHETVNLAKVIEEVLTMYQVIIEKKEILVEERISAGLVFGDEPMIKSVIRNVIDNAIKNTVSGKLMITTQYVPGNSWCEITIADEGKGMSEIDLTSLNNYFQHPENFQFFSSSGFGHKVIRDFLSKLGGDIRYQRNQPSGVTVVLKLPVTTDRVEDRQSVQTALTL